MKKVLLTVSVAAAALLVLPGLAAGQLPAQDSVVGGGSFNGFIDSSYHVRSGPSGENPIGETSVTFPGGTVSASSSIDCLVVNGNTATFAGTGFIGAFFFYPKTTVVDNGSTGSPPDTIAVSGFNAPPGCSEPLDPALSYPLNGDIVVTDAQPFPTSKDQCKNGGWRNFGTTFKNQGQCVSFVATGGKKQP